MATPIEMPKLGNTVDECLLTRWRKRKGETVSAGEVVAEIETDKAAFDVAAPVGGSLLEIFFPEGTVVPVFTNICVIGEAGESVEGFRPREIQPAAAPAAARRDEDGTRGAPARTAEAPVSAPGEVVFSPRARRFAREHGFYPRNVTGSGPQGRVLEEDLIKLRRQAPRVSSLARKLLEEGYEIRGEGSGVNGMVLAADLGPPPVRISGVRERIARRMRESMAATAQYTLNTSADAAGLLSLRRKIKAAPAERGLANININDLVMFASVRALLAMPEINVEFTDGKLYQHKEVTLGFACDTPRGLLVPVVRHCEKLPLTELAAKTKQLARQAIDGQIAPDDLTGGTFTLSNLGVLGIESFTPILNSPQAALLGVNAIELKPVRKNGAIEYVDRIGLSLTCDHQVIDGAVGARFLKVLREQLENVESISGLDL